MSLYVQLPGGEAFPSHPEAGVQRHFIARGMSLRDYFAAKAMQGFVVDLNCGPEHIPNIAVSAYMMADAMLKERNK